MAETMTDRILRRVDKLRTDNLDLFAQRARIRDLMNGGEAGIKALLGPKININEADYPGANLILSGLDRLAQDLQDPPDLKVDPPEDTDSDASKRQAEKRRRIVEGYDYLDSLDMHMPQAARWAPGYGFAVWVLRERIADGNRYPSVELRDPFTCWPGQWGPAQQPSEIAFTRTVAAADVARVYPRAADAITSARYQRIAGGVLLSGDRNWEGKNDGLEVIEYYDERGTWICIPELEMVVDYIPNPLESGPGFVVAKRFAFDQLVGQFVHVIGMMAMMAKLNVLSMIAAQDAVFRETNVIGDMISQSYNRGRNSINYFTPGTRIEKPGADIAFQVFQQIDRIERQIRITQNYPVNQDGISPMSFTTGEGVRELQSSAGKNVKEYQKAFRYALEMVDAKRLEWDEKLYMDERKPFGGGTSSYRPASDIKGRYRTRRVYGVMASWDEPSKLIGGLQLLQAEAIDLETFRENMSGLDNLPLIAERIAKAKSEERLYELLTQEALQGNPQAKAVLVEIQLSGDMTAALTKYFRPENEGENPSPEEMAMMQQATMAGAGGPELPAEAPPVTTVMSQMGAIGGQGQMPEQGVQTVGRL